MADWSKPTLSSLYSDFLSEMKARDDDVAKQFDGTTTTNLVTGYIRWDSSANRWKKWNGTIWAELTATYALTGLSTSGNAAIGGTLGVTGATTLTGALAANGGVTLGNEAGDALTINSSSIAIPNNLSFDSDTLFIDAANNNVGIGTSAPSAKLHVYQTTGSFAALIETGDANTISYQLANSVNKWNLTNTVTTGHFQISDNTAERMRITSSGNVGIGTSSPAAKLDINTGGESNTIARFTSNGSYYSYILTSGVTSVFSSDTSGNNAVQIRGASKQIEFNTNGTERMRIESTGFVKIGVVSAATHLLDVESSQPAGIASTLRVASNGNGGAGRGCAITISSGGSFNSVNVAQIVGYQESAAATANDASLAFNVADVSGTLRERMRINKAGSFQAWTPGTAAGLKPAFFANAWVNFNGTGTVEIRASGNVTSITDGGVGLYTVNFTTDMTDANYSVSGSANRPSTSANCIFAPSVGTYSTTAVQIRTTNSADGATDASVVSVAVFR